MEKQLRPLWCLPVPHVFIVGIWPSSAGMWKEAGGEVLRFRLTLQYQRQVYRQPRQITAPPLAPGCTSQDCVTQMYDPISTTPAAIYQFSGKLFSRIKTKWMGRRTRFPLQQEEMNRISKKAVSNFGKIVVVEVQEEEMEEMSLLECGNGEGGELGFVRDVLRLWVGKEIFHCRQRGNEGKEGKIQLFCIDTLYNGCSCS